MPRELAAIVVASVYSIADIGGMITSEMCPSTFDVHSEDDELAKAF